MRVAIPSNSPGGLEAEISPHFGRCDVFTVVEIKEGKVVEVSAVKNQSSHFGFEKTPAEILASSKVDAILTQGMGPKAMQLFANSGIAIYMTSARRVEDAVRELIENKAKLASLEDACREARESAHSPSTCQPIFGPGMGRGMGRGVGRGFGPYPFMFPPTSFPASQMPKDIPSPARSFKVGVASHGTGGLEDTVSPMFGRCPNFTIVEIEEGKIKGARILPNQFLTSPSGAGIASVQTLAREGVRYILGGRFGPNVAAVAGQFGIKMVTVQPGVRIKEAIEQYILGSR